MPATVIGSVTDKLDVIAQVRSIKRSVSGETSASVPLDELQPAKAELHPSSQHRRHGER